MAYPLLTDAEHEALRLTVELGNCVRLRVVSGGPEMAGDWAEFAGHLHAIQNMILAQAAARAYPRLYRLLGEHPASGDVPAAPDAPDAPGCDRGLE